MIRLVTFTRVNCLSHTRTVVRECCNCKDDEESLLGTWADLGILGKGTRGGQVPGQRGAGTEMSEYSDCYCLNGVLAVLPLYN